MLNEGTRNLANLTLQTFHPKLTFCIWRGRLALDYAGHRNARTVCVTVSKNSGALGMDYGRMGMGGTSAMAVGQLARWIRGQSRVPIAAWEYWASETIKLCTSETVGFLEKHGYDDGKATVCVLCGGMRCGDWWNLNGVTGPCCSMGRCREPLTPAAED